MDQPRLVSQSCVVDRRHVPDEVVREPDRQRESGVRRDPPEVEPRESLRHRSRHAEDCQERRPLREDHVLQQVRRQQVVQTEVVDRRPEGERKEGYRRCETGDSLPRRAETADCEQVEQREDRDDDGGVDIRLPRVRRVRMSDQHQWLT